MSKPYSLLLICRNRSRSTVEGEGGGRGRIALSNTVEYPSDKLPAISGISAGDGERRITVSIHNRGRGRE